MARLTIQRPGAKLSVKNKNLVVVLQDEVVHTIRPDAVDHVHIIGNIEVSAAARNKIARMEVDVVYFDRRGKQIARLVTSDHRSGERRLAQYAASNCNDRRCAIARAIVKGKLLNQRTFLQRLRRERDAEELLGALSAMRHLVRRLDEVETLDEIRGLEGQGAALYFRGMATAILPDEFKFTSRNRRPPRDPINACLSFGYALLLSRVETGVRKAGLDPYVGIFHSTSRGKPSMVLDLMEEFRPVVIDRLILRLINRRQLSASDFENPNVDLTQLSDPEETEDQEDNRPAVYLARTGRAILIRELGHVWRTTHRVPDRDASFEMEAIVDQQAYAMARTLEEPGVPYEPWLLK